MFNIYGGDALRDVRDVVVGVAAPRFLPLQVGEDVAIVRLPAADLRLAALTVGRASQVRARAVHPQAPQQENPQETALGETERRFHRQPSLSSVRYKKRKRAGLRVSRKTIPWSTS